MHDQALRIYLDEHITGARTVIELVDRRLDDGVGPPWLAEFRRDLEEDREVVERIAERLEESGSMPAQTAGVVAQATARAALRLTQALHTSLRDLMEFEAMYVGVQGKACLWRSLELLDGHPVLEGVDLDMLQQRASEHAARLEDFRRDAVRDLATDEPTS